MADILIRPSDEADIPAIRAIYAEAVLTGVASFEIEAPATEEMLRRRAVLLEGGFPYLAAISSADDASHSIPAGTLLGYAYAGPYRPRPAYRFSVENSVYVAPAAQGQGVGKRLMTALIEACEIRGYRRMIAVIGDSGNIGSIRLHAAAGFTNVGILPSVGFKHGRWLDSVLMQRMLGEGDLTPPP